MSMQIMNLTEAAAARLAVLEAKGAGKVVRLSVKSSGCSGHKYDLDYADAPGKHDEVVTRDGATLYVDPLSLMFVAGMTVGWKEDKLERSFTFENPNETGRCGCGESFAA
jgi:iron-sulfur cluster assembly protein